MPLFTKQFDEIAKDFSARGIPTETPGFYDHPKFLEVEQGDPKYLNAYARFVQHRPRDSAYDLMVRKIAPEMAKIYRDALAGTGRLGGCVDVSTILSRALEREGIWNAVIKGSLTITFPPAARIAPRYFWSIDTGQFTAGHAWVMAPPFQVLDISVSLQPYSGREPKFLPPLVCDEGKHPARGSPGDVVSPEVMRHLEPRCPKGVDILTFASADAAQFMPFFGGAQVFHKGTSLKYVPVATGAPDCSFEEIATMHFDGRSAYEHYVEVVRPKLHLK